ncbi:MAG: hypothetical protein ABJP66_07685 [Hyphomicrobiales bacterium]
MAINRRKTVTDGDVVDASKYHQHKAGRLAELIDASLDNHVQTDSGNDSPNRNPPNILVLFIIGAGLILVSFIAYIQMLNVQERVDLLSPDLSYDQLVEMGRDIARSSAIWFYFFVASLVCGAVFLGAGLVLVFLRSFR